MGEFKLGLILVGAKKGILNSTNQWIFTFANGAK